MYAKRHFKYGHRYIHLRISPGYVKTHAIKDLRDCMFEEILFHIVVMKLYEHILVI